MQENTIDNKVELGKENDEPTHITIIVRKESHSCTPYGTEKVKRLWRKRVAGVQEER